MINTILSRIHKTDDCCVWKGNIDPSTGYGRFGQQKAHRLVYTALVGKIPEGLDLDHLCRNRQCVNPTHLEPVTRKINVLRGEGAGALNAKKTHCPQGHEYDRVYGKNRRCSECMKVANRRSYYRKVQAHAGV